MTNSLREPELLKTCGELAGKYGLPVQSHLSENVSEIEWVAHCPTSNFNLSSGIAPVRSFLDEVVYAIQVSKMHYQMDHSKAFLTLPEVFWIATKSAGSFFGKVGSFEPGYDFDALVIDDEILHPDEYSLPHRLERYIYLGDDRQIVHRFCRGQEVLEPAEK